MFAKFTIMQRIVFGFILAIVCMAGALIPLSVANLKSTSEDAQQQKLDSLYLTLINAVEEKSRIAETLSTYIANDPEIQSAMAAGDRSRLSELTLPAFKQLKKNYGVRQFQFHTPSAHSFFRVHKPAKFGDDLSSFRKTVVQANRGKSPVHGVESGVAGLGIRAVVPVFHQGEHLGTVEIGLSLGQFFANKFKEDFNVDVALLVASENDFKPLASTLNETDFLAPEVLRSVLAQQTATQHTEINGEPALSYARALDDFSGNPVAIINFVVDNSHYTGVLNASIQQILIVSIAAIMLSGLIAFFIARSITHPLGAEPNTMARIAKSVADGDLDVEFDEVGHQDSVYAALQHMVTKLRGLVEQVGSSAERVNTGAIGISRDSTELSERTEEQAAGLGEMVASMRQMEDTVAENAKSALRASELSDTVAASALQGEKVVDKANLGMQAINESSHRITEITAVIDEIAFQTNLLALNASVEAAHAGDQGRGFAVVANEVRNLAQRSGEAAQEIKALIQDSVAKVKFGAEQVTETGLSLKQIATSVNDLNQVLTNLASANEQQAAGVTEINKTMTSIETVTLSNSGLVEKTNGASEELYAEAEELTRQMAAFHLDAAGNKEKVKPTIQRVKTIAPAAVNNVANSELDTAAGF